MRHRSLIILTTVLTTGALTLTACGSRDDNSKGSSDSGSKTTVVIGVDAPLTGSLSALGQGIKNSVDLAAKTANKNNEVPGIEFKIEALDDQAVPASGQANATKLVGNKEVLGAVGPLNSGVAQSMQGVFEKADLAQVSPPTPTPPSARATTGARATPSASSRPTSAPAPPTSSRASSPPSTSSTTPRRRRSTSSTTSRPTAPASPRSSPRNSSASAARSSAPTTSR